jgi:hypothetical protein
MTVCVFLGPTLTAADAAEIIDATFLPPVRLGDVYRVVSRLAPRAVGIVDGYFQWTPAVWHKEILWAIGQGVHVFGAASMGALRAAELASFGMHGVGRVFEAYRDGYLPGGDDEPFEDDDEVAVVHGPRASGYRGASEAMVNIRCTLARAAERAVIAESTRRALVAQAKAVFFPDRGYAALLALGRAQGLPEHELTALERWLPTGRVNQKRLDAVAMLETMRAYLGTDPPPASTGVAFERTTSWERAETVFRASAEAPVATLLATLRLDTARCERLGADELRDWYFDHVAEIPVPSDLDAWLREAGYRDRDEFHRAAFIKYLVPASEPGGHP